MADRRWSSRSQRNSLTRSSTFGGSKLKSEEQCAILVVSVTVKAWGIDSSVRIKLNEKNFEKTLAKVKNWTNEAKTFDSEGLITTDHLTSLDWEELELQCHKEMQPIYKRLAGLESECEEWRRRYEQVQEQLSMTSSLSRHALAEPSQHGELSNVDQSLDEEVAKTTANTMNRFKQRFSITRALMALKPEAAGQTDCRRRHTIEGPRKRMSAPDVCLTMANAEANASAEQQDQAEPLSAIASGPGLSLAETDVVPPEFSKDEKQEGPRNPKSPEEFTAVEASSADLGTQENFSKENKVVDEGSFPAIEQSQVAALLDNKGLVSPNDASKANSKSSSPRRSSLLDRTKPLPANGMRASIQLDDFGPRFSSEMSTDQALVADQAPVGSKGRSHPGRGSVGRNVDSDKERRPTLHNLRQMQSENEKQLLNEVQQLKNFAQDLRKKVDVAEEKQKFAERKSEAAEAKRKQMEMQSSLESQESFQKEVQDLREKLEKKLESSEVKRKQAEMQLKVLKTKPIAHAAVQTDPWEPEGFHIDSLIQAAPTTTQDGWDNELPFGKILPMIPVSGREPKGPVTMDTLKDKMSAMADSVDKIGARIRRSNSKPLSSLVSPIGTNRQASKGKISIGSH